MKRTSSVEKHEMLVISRWFLRDHLVSSGKTVLSSSDFISLKMKSSKPIFQKFWLWNIFKFIWIENFEAIWMMTII